MDTTTPAAAKPTGRTGTALLSGADEAAHCAYLRRHLVVMAHELDGSHTRRSALEAIRGQLHAYCAILSGMDDNEAILSLPRPLPLTLPIRVRVKIMLDDIRSGARHSRHERQAYTELLRLLTELAEPGARQRARRQMQSWTYHA